MPNAYKFHVLPILVSLALAGPLPAQSDWREVLYAYDATDTHLVDLLPQPDGTYTLVTQLLRDDTLAGSTIGYLTPDFTEASPPLELSAPSNAGWDTAFWPPRYPIERAAAANGVVYLPYVTAVAETSNCDGEMRPGNVSKRSLFFEGGDTTSVEEPYHRLTAPCANQIILDTRSVKDGFRTLYVDRYPTPSATEDYVDAASSIVLATSTLQDARYLGGLVGQYDWMYGRGDSLAYIAGSSISVRWTISWKALGLDGSEPSTLRTASTDSVVYFVAGAATTTGAVSVVATVDRKTGAILATATVPYLAVDLHLEGHQLYIVGTS